MSDSFSVLIDACAMARLSIYCECCDSMHQNYGTTPSQLFSSLPNHLIRNCLEEKSVNEGYKCFQYLCELTQNYALIVYFSKLSKIELFDIFLDISFDEFLASNGISFRLRRKRPLRWQVNFDYNEKVIARYNSIIKCLDQIGISLTFPEADPRSSYKTAFEICDILSSHIFLDSFDAYLYSLSIFLMVDEILSFDNEFKVVMKDFSQNGHWKTHRDAFKSEVINVDSDYQTLCCDESKNGSFDIDKFKLPSLKF